MLMKLPSAAKRPTKSNGAIVKRHWEMFGVHRHLRALEADWWAVPGHREYI